MARIGHVRTEIVTTLALLDDHDNVIEEREVRDVRRGDIASEMAASAEEIVKLRQQWQEQVNDSSLGAQSGRV